MAYSRMIKLPVLSYHNLKKEHICISSLLPKFNRLLKTKDTVATLSLQKHKYACRKTDVNNVNLLMWGYVIFNNRTDCCHNPVKSVFGKLLKCLWTVSNCHSCMQRFSFFKSVIPYVYNNCTRGNRCYCSHVPLPRWNKFTCFSV